MCTIVHTIECLFEWDDDKETLNVQKHGISFVLAAKLFLKPRFEMRSDKHGEVRYLTMGEVENCTLTVVYTRRKNRCRIISARRASRNEEKKYQENSRSFTP